MRSFIRFISRNKLYSAIESVGLSVSLAFIIIIFCFVSEQLSVRHEFENSERIYAVCDEKFIASDYAMKQSVVEAIPEVELATHFYTLDDEKFTIKAEEKILQVRMSIACDRAFFELFPQYFVEGNPDAINGKNSVILSESLANSLFENRHEAMGKSVNFAGYDFTVAGIIRNGWKSMLYPYEVFVNCEEFEFLKDEREIGDNFNAGSWNTYFRLQQNADIESVKKKMDVFCRSVYPDLYRKDGTSGADVIRLDKVFFSEKNIWFNGGSKTMLIVLIIAGLALLVSAVFNYINLNAALTGKRAKEMAMRRLLGAEKRNVLLRYFAESLAFTTICFLIGLLIAIAIMPLIWDLIGTDIMIEVPFTPKYIICYALMILVVAFVSGLVPAIMVSRFSPLDVTKGSFRLRNKQLFSKVFIVLQNMIAVILIAFSLVLELQVRHFENKPTGCDFDNKFYIELGVNYDEMLPLADKLKALPCVKSIGFVSDVPGKLVSSIEEKEEKPYSLRPMCCDTTTFNMLKFKEINRFSDIESGSVLLSESAFKALGFDAGHFDLEGTPLAKYNNVAGVVEDFIVVFGPIAKGNESGVIIIQNPENLHGGLLVETIGNQDDARKEISKVYGSYSKEKHDTFVYPYTMNYLSEIKRYSTGGLSTTKTLIEIFSIVAILISILGLVAMSTFFASENRNRIAICKVFGSTIEEEIIRNLRNYSIMVLISNILAIPIAVWISNIFLERYYYRIDLHSWIFIVTVLISFAIAIGSVLWQIVSVAKVNPAEALKKE